MKNHISSAKNLSIRLPFRSTRPIRNEEALQSNQQIDCLNNNIGNLPYLLYGVLYMGRTIETNKHSSLQAPYKSYRLYEKSKTLENRNHIGIDVLNRHKDFAGLKAKAEKLRLKYDSDDEKNKPQEILHRMLRSIELIAPNNMLIASRKLKDYEPKTSDIRFPLRTRTRHPSSVGKIYSETVKALCIENPILKQVQHFEVAPLNSLL